MTIDLDDAEVNLILEALAHHPDPEGCFFGPAYELEKERADKLRAKLIAAGVGLPA